MLAWELSNCLEAGSCLEALDRALEGSLPGIFNTDGGAQFTSQAFTGRLERAGVRVRMDGRGRVSDNIFIERLWRTLKHEDVDVRDHVDGARLRMGLESYFRFYNTERLHPALGNRPPERCSYGRAASRVAVRGRSAARVATAITLDQFRWIPGHA